MANEETELRLSIKKKIKKDNVKFLNGTPFTALDYSLLSLGANNSKFAFLITRSRFDTIALQSPAFKIAARNVPFTGTEKFAHFSSLKLPLLGTPVLIA